ncbi:MAG: phosphopentomutase [Melioribacteraceae bacterium]|nr:phosphopentomutase [Melioribacteraceae bacterium]MCO6474556.1 phosphopentomutase [Melioribacteraceae bacterium]MDD3558143.1 phosphopentomutase [Melioribacteraceae bacterium]
MNNFIIIVLDGVGIGEMPDADKYGDKGSNTLGNIAKKFGGLNLPNLHSMGLGNITSIEGFDPVDNPTASFGKMAETAKGKDSTSGHWEIGGLKVDIDFPYYPKGFPEEIISKFVELTGVPGILGNIPASGTEIIKELGSEHIKTKKPIVYTSADSVFQIAAHEEIIPLKELYRICLIARNEVLVGKHSVGRVIARPFLGTDGNFERTTNRKDFSIDPIKPTILDYLHKNEIKTIAIGKVNDLFNYRGIEVNIKTKSNAEGINALVNQISVNSNTFIFSNLVDFDVYFGHRNDPAGFHKALKEFDSALPDILNKLDNSDILIITADHGNDPTTKSTDHSREFVPLLCFKKNSTGKNLGIRKTFADVAQSAAEFFKVNNDLKGTSFLPEL